LKILVNADKGGFTQIKGKTSRAQAKLITTESQRTLRKAKSMCGFWVEVRFYLRASALICVQRKRSLRS
jgi:hypothetical protein